MAVQGIDISLISSFGSRGSGTGEFEYPSGGCIVGSLLYVVDRQNHRIQIFDLDGNYSGEFGTKGSGNDEFNYPERITSDGVSLYITDGANHRIKKHSLAGVYESQFGTRGSGDDEFDYPIGITTDNTYLYISDRQNNRIKKHSLAGAYITETTGLNYPEGLTVFNDNTNIAICNSGNDTIDIYSLNLQFIQSLTNTRIQYITDIVDCGDVLSVCDRERGSILNLDYEGNFISEIQSVFKYPLSLIYDDSNERLYIIDSSNHRVSIYIFVVVSESLKYYPSILNLTKQLYPTGRAWMMQLNSYFDRLHQGLAISEARAYEDILGLLNKTLPDNDSFSETDATNWERSLGIETNTGLSLDERKAIILRLIQYPGTELAKQHYTYIENELQKVGFDVYIFENRFPDGLGGYDVINPQPTVYNNFLYGAPLYGGSGVGAYSLIQNYINQDKDSIFAIADISNLRATFFVGGINFGDRAEIPLNRRNEFRALILKLKPAQMVGYLLIDYI